MKKDLCFIFDDVKVYTDECLVRDEMPIFFTGIDDEGKHYVALCVDMDMPRYCVIRVTATQLYCMLNGILSMRNIFMCQKSYWEVTPIDNVIENDNVTLKSMEEMDSDDLPDKDSYFQLFNDSLKKYSSKLNEEILGGQYEALSIIKDFNNLEMEIEIHISDNFKNAMTTLETYKRLVISVGISPNIMQPLEYKEMEDFCVIKNFSAVNKEIISNKISINSLTDSACLEVA